MDASGVPPSPSRLFAVIPPRPRAQANTVPSTFISPWRGFPGLVRTVKTVKGLRFFRSAPFRSLFFEYDRVSKQITLAALQPGFA